MTTTWTWARLDAGGSPIAEASTSGPMPPASFPTQADAEAWLGESWQDLLDEGVQQVALMHGDHLVYGPMSLLGES